MQRNCAIYINVSIWSRNNSEIVKVIAIGTLANRFSICGKRWMLLSPSGLNRKECRANMDLHANVF